MHMLYRITISALAGVLLSACGGGDNTLDKYLPDQRLEYKKQREASESLEIPPDLTSGNFDDALDVPAAASGSATYSEYVGGRARQRQVAQSGEVLPEVNAVKLRRDGNSRWLEIKASPQQVWPRVVEFWRGQGILLVQQEPAVGIMKTDWLENRAELRKDFVTRMMRKVADGLYATSTRDQFRVRLEAGSVPGSTDLYLTMRSMEEQLVNNTVGDADNTVWAPTESDPETEAAMLRRLMVYLGANERVATSATASPSGPGPTRPSSVRIVTVGGGSALVMQEEFRRAWRMTGSALDRVGFAVEDRDRSRGVYFVRYDDLSKRGEKKGWGSKLAFWKSDDLDPVKQYQVRVTSEGNSSQVTVNDAAGRRDDSETGQRILTLLKEQMR